MRAVRDLREQWILLTRATNHLEGGKRIGHPSRQTSSVSLSRRARTDHASRKASCRAAGIDDQFAQPVRDPPGLLLAIFRLVGLGAWAAGQFKNC
ncbi:MAG: hypothetical protein QOI01_1965 [Mycobacterium sp.]|jgi:hypothetical protein|nr:hypothetical protein [Mycobacterium sp.]